MVHSIQSVKNVTFHYTMIFYCGSEFLKCQDRSFALYSELLRVKNLPSSQLSCQVVEIL